VTNETRQRRSYRFNNSIEIKKERKKERNEGREEREREGEKEKL